MLCRLRRQCAGVSQRPAGPFGVAAAKREASRALSSRLTPAPTCYLRRRFTPASSPGRTPSRRTGRGIERYGRGPCGRSAGSRRHCRPTWWRLSVRCFRYSLSDFSYERRREPCRCQVLYTRGRRRQPAEGRVRPEAVVRACPGAAGSFLSTAPSASAGGNGRNTTPALQTFRFSRWNRAILGTR